MDRSRFEGHERREYDVWHVPDPSETVVL